MRELKLTRKKLNPDNKEVLSNIRRYIYAKGVNQKIINEIELDIAGMLLESQERGEDAGKVIGEDYKAFCDELVRNCPRKKIIDYVLNVLLSFSVAVVVWILANYMYCISRPSYDSNVDGLILHSSVFYMQWSLWWLFLMMMFSILLMLILIIRISPFTKVKGRLKISLCGMLTGVLCSEIFDYIFDNIPSNQRYSLNLLTIGMASVLTFAVTWVALEWRMRRQLASYKKTSGDNK